MAHWRNWAETVDYDHLEKKYVPKSLDALHNSVIEAKKKGWKLRSVGPGHAWSNLGVPSQVRGAVVDMTEMPEIFKFVEKLDNDEAIFDVGGGLTVKRLNEKLFDEGWAVFNMGDANPQTIVGAISTETHGSGIKHASVHDRLGSLSECVEGMSIMGSNGELYDLSTDDELFAGRVSLGKLGIIHSVRLRVRRKYFLTHVQELVTFNEANEGETIKKLLNDNSVRHFEYWHYPHTDKAERIVRRRTDSEETINPLRLDQEWLIQSLSGAFEDIGTVAPKLIPGILQGVVNNPSLRKLFEVTRQGPAHEILLGKSNEWRKRVKTFTMEYQLPLHQLWPAFYALEESIRIAKGKEVFVAPPTQIRFTQQSERSFMTHLLFQPTVSFSFSFFRQHKGAHTWLPELERRLLCLGGQPHWGKMYYTQPYTEPELLKKFSAVQQKLDPDGMFAFQQNLYVPDAEAFQDF